jgi:hypothetical protein
MKLRPWDQFFAKLSPDFVRQIQIIQRIKRRDRVQPARAYLVEERKLAFYFRPKIEIPDQPMQIGGMQAELFCRLGAIAPGLVDCFDPGVQKNCGEIVGEIYRNQEMWRILAH